MGIYRVENSRIVPRADYHAVQDKRHRQVPRSITKSEDDWLSPSARRKLNATTRDQARNFALAAWMIRKHLDYVSRFRFQARTPDDGFNGNLEALVGEYSHARRLHTHGRHNLDQIMRLTESGAVVDGDIFWLLLRSGRMQGIESDRVRRPRTSTGLPAGMKLSDISKHGIIFNSDGRAGQWCVCKRDGARLDFERLVPNRNMLQRGYFTRFDQWRGVSPLAGAINSLTDVYESVDYNLIKAKLHALFGVVITRPGTDTGLLPSATDSETSKGITEEQWKRFKPGVGTVFDLGTGASIETIESKSPPTQFIDFTEMVIHIALLALDIPFTFWDSRKSSFSARIGDNLQYATSADTKREANKSLLNRWTAWRLRLGIYRDRDIRLPRGMELEDLRWEWQAVAPYPWADPLKETKADVEQVKAGLTSRTEICARHGRDFKDIVDDLAAEQKYLDEKGVKLEGWTADFLSAQTGQEEN